MVRRQHIACIQYVGFRLRQHDELPQPGYFSKYKNSLQFYTYSEIDPDLRPCTMEFLAPQPNIWIVLQRLARIKRGQFLTLFMIETVSPIWIHNRCYFEFNLHVYACFRCATCHISLAAEYLYLFVIAPYFMAAYGVALSIY